jgi:hypothetical protein
MMPASTTFPQRRDGATDGISLQSLRRAKDRRRAVADPTQPEVSIATPTANAPKLLEMQIKVQQMDISHLKKERDDITGRLKKLEALPERFDDIANRVEQQKDVSEVLQPALDRLSALEKYPLASELPNLRKEVEKLKLMLNRLDAVEKSQLGMDLPSLQRDVGQLQPVLGRLDAFGKSISQKHAADIQPLSSRIEGLEAASLPCTEGIQDALSQAKNANIVVGELWDLKKDVTQLKNSTELQKIDITTLNTWKAEQLKAIDEDTIKKLVLEEVITRTNDVRKGLRNEVQAVETRQQNNVSQLQTSMKACLDFKTTIENLNVSAQLTALTTKLRELEGNDSKTYNRTTRLEKSVNDMDTDIRKLAQDIGIIDNDINKIFQIAKNTDETIDDLRKDSEEYIGPIQKAHERTGLSILERLDKVLNFATAIGQIPHHQSEITKMSSGQKVITADLNKLFARVNVLEKAASSPAVASGPGVGYKKVGKPVPLSSPKTNSSNFADITDQRMGQLDKDVKELRQALEETKGLAAKVERLDARLADSAPSSSLAELETRLSEQMQFLTTTLGSRLSDAETRVERMKDASGSVPHPLITSDPGTITQDLSAIREDLGQLDTGLTEAEATIHQHATQIGTLQQNLTLLFKNNFDPFKQTVEEQLGTVNSKLEAYGVDVNELRQHVSESRAQSQQTNLSDIQQAQLQSIVKDAASLKGVVDRLESSLQTGITISGQELCTKADAVVIKNQLEAFTYALNHLETRYENITTDEQYQRMVHWFNQSYPNATAVTNYAQIQQDINQLKSFHRQVSWIQGFSQELSRLVLNASVLHGLVTNAPQLKTLVNSAPQIEDLLKNASQLQALAQSPSESPSTLAKIEQACSDVKTAVDKADQAGQEVGLQHKTLEGLKTVISGLQTSFHNLNSPASPFVRADALEMAIKSLEAQVGEEKKVRLATINGLRKTFGDEHDKRVEVEKQIRTSMNELKQLRITLEPRVTQVEEQVSQIEASSSQLRTDFDTMNNTLIEPNRDFLGLFGTMLAVVTQLQQVIESLNQTLPITPLKLDWAYDLTTLGVPETNGDDATKGKGKGNSKQ